MPTSTDQPEPCALQARYVFPVTSDPIPDGILTMQGRRIVSAGSQPPAVQPLDLGNVAIIPGLVNAHVHLELSDLPKPLGEPGMGLTEWLRCVIELRRQVGESSRRPVEAGLRESCRSGTTTLAEIAQPGWPIDLFEHGPLRATVLLELIAPKVEQVEPALERGRQHVELARASTGWLPGLSPHAPYSVHPDLISGVVRLSAAERVPVAMHLAESPEEIELISSASGPFRDLLKDLGAWDPGVFSPARRPLDYLRALAPAHRALVVHGNYLDEPEIAFLAERSDRMAVVYCPRTHGYFRHPEYPLTRLLERGATVALGTDSRASSPDLSVLAEMRLVARTFPTLARDKVLQLGTICGARALGLEREVGSLEPGKYADLAVVALPDREAEDPHELLFDSDLPVVGTYCAGRTVDDWPAA